MARPALVHVRYGVPARELRDAEIESLTQRALATELHGGTGEEAGWCDAFCAAISGWQDVYSNGINPEDRDAYNRGYEGFRKRYAGTSRIGAEIRQWLPAGGGRYTTEGRLVLTREGEGPPAPA